MRAISFLFLESLWRLISEAMKPATIERPKSYETAACVQCGNYTLVLVQGTLACDSCGATEEAPYQ